VQVETSGRINDAIGLTTQGQGHETAFAQVAAEVLGARLEDVHVTSGDTRRFGYAVGTFASRAAVMSGNAVGLRDHAIPRAPRRRVDEGQRYGHPERTGRAAVRRPPRPRGAGPHDPGCERLEAPGDDR
jgi:CO/xanthine dehydrogenase Mo-binding subunit